jgi:hypothetical protein
MEKTLKRGDSVTVNLTAEHELPDGDGAKLHAHAAKFIRRLPGQDWAEVELQEEHAGGTKTLHVPLDAIEAAQ